MKEIYRSTGIDPNPALAFCFSPTLANLLTSFTMAVPSKPVLPPFLCSWKLPLAHGLEAVAGPMEVGCAQLVHKGNSWTTHNENKAKFVLWTGLPYEIGLSPLCWLGQFHSGHPWIAGSTYLLQSLLGDPYSPQMNNNPDFLFYFFLFHGNRSTSLPKDIF